jgi:hypothetical protein
MSAKANIAASVMHPITVTHHGSFNRYSGSWEAFDLCDTIISRCVLEGQKVLLFELGTVVDDLCRVTWRLRESIRHAFKLQPRSKQAPQAVNSAT